jgi:hypothetical protein
MNDGKAGLSKLRQLCDELTDRDEQLKVNAAALWEILEIVSGVTEDLSSISLKSSADKKVLEKCTKKLDRISCLVKEKGCRKVTNGH